MFGISATNFALSSWRALNLRPTTLLSPFVVSTFPGGD
jgi:hypothetical protein